MNDIIHSLSDNLNHCTYMPQTKIMKLLIPTISSQNKSEKSCVVQGPMHTPRPHIISLSASKHWHTAYHSTPMMLQSHSHTQRHTLLLLQLMTVMMDVFKDGRNQQINIWQCDLWVKRSCTMANVCVPDCVCV